MDSSRFDPAHKALLLEACRIGDRLDRLDRHLDGEDWLNFEVNDDRTVVTVIVDKALAEARQQALAFKQIVSELRLAAGKSAVDPSKGASGLADLTARIAARRAGTAG